MVRYKADIRCIRYSQRKQVLIKLEYCSDWIEDGHFNKWVVQCDFLMDAPDWDRAIESMDFESKRKEAIYKMMLHLFKWDDFIKGTLYYNFYQKT